MKIAVLGYGRIGRAIVDDLCKQGHDVTVCDNNTEIKLLENTAGRPFSINRLNVLDEWSFARCLADKDLVVNALPGSIGYQVTKSIIELRTNVVDISFFPEDPEPLRKVAREHKVIAAIDCGLAPGIWNMILAHCESEFETTSCKCYVGGLPKNPKWPFGYKAPYHPRDVVEMYTRKSRFIKNGEIITKSAISDLELLTINGIMVEAFNTDGLRTLLNGMKTPTIVEKTLRYPGHAEQMKMFRDVGFFNQEKVWLESEKVWISPIDLFAKLVFPYWQYYQEDQDLTLMLVIVDGKNGDKNIRRTFKLVDEGKEFSSMARTTGYTATAVVDLIDREVIMEPGLYAPEDIGRVACQNVIHYLQDRNVVFRVKENKG